MKDSQIVSILVGELPHLLAKANSRTCVEGYEDVWVRSQILVQATVEEPVWVKLESWGGGQVSELAKVV